MEVFNKGSVRQMQSGMGTVIYPSGKIKKLEKQLEFSDTFNNRVLLADAYLASGNTERAIQLYESSLTGAFAQNEHVLAQLVIAYYNVQRYDDAIKVAKKIYNNPVFNKTHAHVVYAMALGKAGKTEEAEKEFNTMKGKYSYFESRYQYGIFLINENKTGKARKIFSDIVNEFSYLSSFEKRNNRIWFNNAKTELRKINIPSGVH